MGTYCQLYVAGYPIYSTKSQVDPMAMTIFRESDKKILQRKCNERNQIEWGHANWEDDEVETVVEYSSTASDVKDRLRIMGFTKSHAEADFSSSKNSRLAELKEMNSEDNLWDEEIKLLEDSSFQSYLTAISEILQSGVHPVYFIEQKTNASQLAKYMMRYEEGLWGFPCSDLRSFFRALIEVIPETSLFSQDITDLVNGGYYRGSDSVSNLALSELKGDYSSHSKIILLTEGTTDSQILKESLEFLYPHLSEYYSFVDLAVRSPGGVGSLVQVVKSFAGAGIENRIIGIFDNDTAGHSASSVLRTIPLPSNVRIIHLPNTLFASNYPTIGPSGLVNQNINGKACSIELYFGSDVLKEDGHFVPIQWKGFDEKIKRYQGEIQKKDILKKKYLEKIALGRSSSASFQSGDWENMKMLLETIFDVFN